MIDYDPTNWFWIVAGDESRAWSSAASGYVAEWSENRVTRIASEDELSDVLRSYALKHPKPSVDDVTTERERRLQLGFDYDFGDARGVHRIGTTDADMKGWDEVTKASLAAIAIGAPETVLAIVTNTGPATLTALEWQHVLLAATAARQPLWAASFALEAMNPIPVDYAADSRWITS